MTIQPSTLFNSKVSVLSGTVSKLNHELLEYVNPEKPMNDDSAIYFQRFYIAQFNLDDRAIVAQFSSPMTIHQGDVLAVSGYPKGNVFQVLAYANQTQDVRGAENWLILALGALFFLAVAIGLLNSALVSEGSLVPKLFLMGFVGVGLYMVYRALLIREAIALL
ncbi:hypothetical protein [Polynucleobacter antarcticus]|uniref:Uncharacterized protein n=1 Tax=Polynucleobacter antarcticus TaxID=1743162 RepID=A0A6M9PS08_9BURK|nr:hypothetical protein [Polynucleobacter antarcticus]QKM62278.1 hypothetical protein DCO16_03840 [Polynucleobacter antarcticus]